MIGDFLSWYLPWSGESGGLRIMLLNWVIFFALPALVLWATALTLSWWHARSLERRERAPGRPPVCTLQSAPEGYGDPRLVTASVVSSHAAVRALSVLAPKLFGGHIGVLDRMARRARREALLRLEAAAAAEGADLIIGLRMVARGAGFRRDDGGLSVEVLVFGTALSRLPEQSR